MLRAPGIGYILRHGRLYFHWNIGGTLIMDKITSCPTCGHEYEYIDRCDNCEENENNQADKDQQSINNYLDGLMEQV